MSCRSNLLLTTSSVSDPGFSDYALPAGENFSGTQQAQKTRQIVLSALYGTGVIASLAICPISIPLSLIGSVSFSYLTIKNILKTIGIANQAPPMHHLFPEVVVQHIPPLGVLSTQPCRGFVTADGMESHTWKLELIRSARHAIVLSGCYCGGESFNEVLGLIRQQMRVFPELTTAILASDVFLTKENQRLIKELEQEFSPRFRCLITPEMMPNTSLATGRFSLIVNHTKALVIDYGAYFMLGGSGIVDSWTSHKGDDSPVRVKPQGCLKSKMVPQAFRDMDFVFNSEVGGAGTRLHIEMMKLVERFQYRVNATVRESTIWPDRVQTQSLRFEEVLHKVDSLRIACYATSLENAADNPFLREIIQQVKHARTSIVINHMYFHPPKALSEALIEAANRDVTITIITNQLTRRSPGLHLFYGSRNQAFASSLLQEISKPNINFHFYNIPGVTLHKKGIVVDGTTTLLGSSNIGPKSLEEDYEINIKVESPFFARQVLLSCKADIGFSEPLEPTQRISTGTKVCGAVQSLFTGFL